MKHYAQSYFYCDTVKVLVVEYAESVLYRSINKGVLGFEDEKGGKGRSGKERGLTGSVG